MKKLHFSPTHRLLNKAEFKSVFDQAEKVSQKHILVLFKPGEKNHSRLGLIVSKKISKKAVTRNTIKRIVRESFRLSALLEKGLDIIVIARHNCNTLKKSELRRGIDKLWEKLLQNVKKSSKTVCN